MKPTHETLKQSEVAKDLSKMTKLGKLMHEWLNHAVLGGSSISAKQKLNKNPNPARN